MGCRLRIFLNKHEHLTLENLRKALSVPQRTRDRAQMILFNARGLKNEQIAKVMNCSIHTVRQSLHRWETKGLAGLWDVKGRGAKSRWSELDFLYLDECLEKEQRTYNAKQLAYKLQGERQIKLSPERIRRILKKRG